MNLFFDQNQNLLKNKCICKKDSFVTKKWKAKTRRERNSFPYPQSNEVLAKTFSIKSNKNLSLTAKLILNTFQNKYIYYAIDDILYLLNSRMEERNYLLEILYSPIISLQNNFSINFFDIWISEIYIDENSKSNRFLSSKKARITTDSIITMKFFYKIPKPVKKQESLW